MNIFCESKVGDGQTTVVLSSLNEVQADLENEHYCSVIGHPRPDSDDSLIPNRLFMWERLLVRKI